MNGTLETIDGRPALRFERRLRHPVERVWRAVTEPAELARWFVAPVEWTPRVGETFEAMEQSGEITEVEPPHRFAYLWGGEMLRFELEPDAEGCRLTFLHVFDDRTFAADHASGWEWHFSRLDALLEDRPVPETPEKEALLPVHDRYAERFSLDPEPGRRRIDEYFPPDGPGGAT